MLTTSPYCSTRMTTPSRSCPGFKVSFGRRRRCRVRNLREFSNRCTRCSKFSSFLALKRSLPCSMSNSSTLACTLSPTAKSLGLVPSGSWSAGSNASTGTQSFSLFALPTLMLRKSPCLFVLSTAPFTACPAVKFCRKLSLCVGTFFARSLRSLLESVPVSDDDAEETGGLEWSSGRTVSKPGRISRVLTLISCYVSQNECLEALPHSFSSGRHGGGVDPRPNLLLSTRRRRHFGRNRGPRFFQS